MLRQRAMAAALVRASLRGAQAALSTAAARPAGRASLRRIVADTAREECAARFDPAIPADAMNVIAAKSGKHTALGDYMVRWAAPAAMRRVV